MILEHAELGTRWCCVDDRPAVLVTGNETNDELIFGVPNAAPYVKDGIDRYVVHGEQTAVDPSGIGTKAAFDHTMTLLPGQSRTVRLRLRDTAPGAEPFDDFDVVMLTRRAEADAFYDEVLDGVDGADDRRIMRQAMAGMLWSKQFFALDVERWLLEHGADPLEATPTCVTTTGGTSPPPT